MLNGYFKKRRIKRFANKLPRELRRLYGKYEFYTKGQVDRAVKNRFRVGSFGGVAVTDVCYAYAMFCSPEEFERIHDETGEICNYESMREEISETCFSGSSGFSVGDLSTYSSGAFSGDGSSGFSGSDGGGD